MTIKEFLTELKREITKTNNGGRLGKYTFFGINKSDSFGSAGGTWPIDKYPAFELHKDDQKFLLRVIPELGKIVIEAIHLKSMLINYTLNDNNFIIKDSNIKLLDNFVMTVKHSIRREIVKDALKKAGMSSQVIIELNNKNINWGNVLNSLFNWADYREKAKEIIRNQNKKVIKTGEVEKIELFHPLNQILFGPPGTGKTYNTINKALEIIGVDVTNLDRKSIKEEFDKKMKDGQIVFTTFHQSMSYEDFIEGIKPKTNNDGNVTYDIEDGIFKLISNQAEINYLNSLELSSDFDEVFEILKTQWIESDNSEIDVKMKGNSFWITNITNRNIKFRKPSGGTGHDLVIKTLKDLYDNKRQMDSGLAIYYYPLIEKLRSFSKKSNKKNEIKNYVLIIDEINRGNVSQIFGELITLIEEDKRIGKDEALELTLPYSKESFCVPPNLYLIGTMNTADRSVEAIDTALRRRFSFTEMPPRYDLDLLTYDYAGTTGKVILETINARIEKLLDKDHLIGHSFFLKKEDEDAETKLKNSFYRNIIPLLQEYFYGDYAKIGAVLGSGFLKLKEEKGNDKLFAEFDGFESVDYIEKNTYQIIDYRLVETNYSIKKDGKLISMDFEKAIKLLINMSVD